ncbi:hypothetical protein [Cryptosporangium arvum]|uniref:hypothetical protein n=1 Tax=Cryptosporangium arvum TaxID=80871 RepID=UPI00055B97BC|nr:hypothetical protein [Cryptosporangium arvum]
MDAQQFRAEFDARVEFSNGGHLAVAGFRVDVPSADVSADQVATLFVRSLGLLMSEHVDVTALRVLAEAHKGTRGGPSAPNPATPADERRLVDLSTAGTTITGGALALDRVADLPAVVVRTLGAGARAVGVGSLAPFDVGGRAVLFHTGEENPHLTADGARWLADHDAALVGLDGAAPPVLLATGLPVVEHLTGLDRLPPHGARFTAAPPRLTGVGNTPVRAFAAV